MSGTVLPAGAQAGDPPWSVAEAELAAALECPATFEHPDREPVLLVHGTGTTGPEEYGWNHLLLLPDRGFDTCVVTYPDRGFGDLQVSAEYVAHAVLELHERTGRAVDVMGHSQGGLLPRWAVKFWPSVEGVVDDAVLVAPPSHGTGATSGSVAVPFSMPAAFFQMRYEARFLAALNAGDETPGDVDWSVLFTDLDLLVYPSRPVPTAALDWGREGPRVRNVRIQDVCPGRVVDHVTIGTTDRLSQELVIDALANPGPVDPERLGPPDLLCALPDQYVDPRQLELLREQMQRSFAGGFPDFHRVDEEPPLKPYAAAALAQEEGPSDPSDPAAGGGGGAGALPAPGTELSPSGEIGGTGRAGGTLPATGAAVPLAPVGAALVVALVLLALRRRARLP